MEEMAEAMPMMLSMVDPHDFALTLMPSQYAMCNTPESYLMHPGSRRATEALRLASTPHLRAAPHLRFRETR